MYLIFKNIFSTISEDALLKACKNWWGEFKKVGIQASLVVNGNNFIKIGHATQMAWAETTEIGCGVAKCPNAPYKTYTVCQYNKPLDLKTLIKISIIFSGNYLGQVIYKKGTPCSGCGSTGCASNGLCN